MHRSAIRRSALVLGSLVALAWLACVAGPRLSEPADACQAARSRSAPFENADLAAGARLYATECAECHSLTADRQGLKGPHLHGLVSRRIGSTAHYRYASALKDLEDRWTLSALDQYIEAPEWFIPGTRMRYDGLASPDERLDLIAFLACGEMPAD